LPSRPGNVRRVQRLQVRFARETNVEGFEQPRGFEQQRSSITVAVEVHRDLTPQPLDHRALEIVKRPGLHRRKQRERRLRRTGLLLGSCRGERPTSPSTGFRRQRGGALTHVGHSAKA
jgi:hypothetical protein